MNRTDAEEQTQAADRLRRHLREIARLWPDLLDEMTNPTNPTTTGRATPSPDHDLRGDWHAAHIVKAVTHDAWYLASIIDRETRAPGLPNPLRDLPAALTWIATWRADWITHHHDEWLRNQLLTDWSHNYAQVRHGAAPDRTRMLPLDIPCPDHTDLDPLGRRLPCPGHLRAPLAPDHDDFGGLVCDHDKTHRISAEEWMRAARRVQYDHTRIGTALRARRAVQRGAT